MRSTFEARGYTAWDPTSPAFLVCNEHGATLTIPSVFVSYTRRGPGQEDPAAALDARAQPRRPRRAGADGAHARARSYSTLGAEQEYFLVRRDLYDARPDLEVTGRTVIGTTPPKGQQMEDNYFGAIDDRALDFMGEVEIEAWKLGIPVRTRHNEVAPHQYEAAPIYQADQRRVRPEPHAHGHHAQGGPASGSGRALPREALRRRQRLGQAQQLVHGRRGRAQPARSGRQPRSERRVPVLPGAVVRGRAHAARASCARRSPAPATTTAWAPTRRRRPSSRSSSATA